jgi:hypothetical protein
MRRVPRASKFSIARCQVYEQRWYEEASNAVNPLQTLHKADAFLRQVVKAQAPDSPERQTEPHMLARQLLSPSKLMTASSV